MGSRLKKQGRRDRFPRPFESSRSRDVVVVGWGALRMYLAEGVPVYPDSRGGLYVVVPSEIGGSGGAMRVPDKHRARFSR